MNVPEAARILKTRYDEAKARFEQIPAIHLFGIEFAEELDDMSLSDILIEAEMSMSYTTEIYKGMRLAKYVELKA